MLTILLIVRLFQEEVAQAAGYDLQGIIAIGLVVTFIILMAGWYMGLTTRSAASILSEGEAKPEATQPESH